jgi:hypothetical protein
MADSKSGAAKASVQNTEGEGIATADDGTQYPESQAPPAQQETLDKVTYRDPRPLDWPQKADRSVFIGAVHSTKADDDGGEKKGYVYANQAREDEELQLGGTAVETAQVVSGSGQLVLILDGTAYNLSGLGAAVQSDLVSGLAYNA